MLSTVAEWDLELAEKFEKQREQLQQLADLVERSGAKLREASQIVTELTQQLSLLRVERDAALAEVEELRLRLRQLDARVTR